MAKKSIVTFAFLIVLSFGFILVIPIGLLSNSLLTYAIINETISYEYVPDTSSGIETLNLNVESGNIQIKYIDPPMSYFAKIDVNVEMHGPGLAGKDYLDYFIIKSGNLTGSPIDFSMEILPNITEFERNTLIQDISIVVTLRKDIIFNISTIVINGNIELLVPYNVEVNNLSFKIIDGNILFNLKNCIVDGNITGIGNSSNIEVRTYDIQCTKNTIWYINNQKGELIYNLSQLNVMGANVTAIAELGSGEAVARVFYSDFSSDIGCIVNLNNWEGYYPTHCTWVGFDDSVVNLFTSYDVSPQNYYNISLNVIPSDMWRPFFWTLYSEPN